MTAHNKTVQEMGDTSADEVGVYRFTKADGDKLMRKLGHQTADQVSLDKEVGNALQEKGGLVGKLARHCQKWLTDPGSVTTIPLTDSEYKQVAKLGAKLTEV